MGEQDWCLIKNLMPKVKPKKIMSLNQLINNIFELGRKIDEFKKDSVIKNLLNEYKKYKSRS